MRQNILLHTNEISLKIIMNNKYSLSIHQHNKSIMSQQIKIKIMDTLKFIIIGVIIIYFNVKNFFLNLSHYLCRNVHSGQKMHPVAHFRYICIYLFSASKVRRFNLHSSIICYVTVSQKDANRYRTHLKGSTLSRPDNLWLIREQSHRKQIRNISASIWRPFDFR